MAAEFPDLPVLDHDSVRRHLLDCIMLVQRDHWLLVKELRSLSVKEALRFLRYCQSLLQMHGVAANVKHQRPKGARVPPISCVVDWTNAVLDAHFSSLVLNSESHGLLKVRRTQRGWGGEGWRAKAEQELKELARGERELTREVASMDGLLLHLLRRQSLPVKPMKFYTVETLYL
eukprot:347291-Hanusia_phi.AAC.4